MPFNIIFAGTPEFAVPSLQALVNSSHHVIAVYTQPDRPAGRGRKLTPSPVKQFAQEHSLCVYQPQTLRDVNEQQKIAHLRADIMVVVAYGLILPVPVLTAMHLGCVNVHASLLPRWRGAAPIQRAILAGDQRSGITIMQINEGLDTGDMLTQAETAIDPQDTSQTLHERLAKMGASLLLDTLFKIEQGTVRTTPQENAKALYAPKIEKSEAKINWQQSAIDIDRKIRAFNPWPIAYTEFDQQTLRIWQAVPIAEKCNAIAGTVLNINKNDIDVATGDGILKLLRVQLPNSRVLDVKDFVLSPNLKNKLKLFY